jgi:hypothetical protein
LEFELIGRYNIDDCNIPACRTAPGSLEGFCAQHLKLRDFFTLLSLEPKGDRVSLRGGMVYSRSVKEFNMISFDQLLDGNG